MTDIQGHGGADLTNNAARQRALFTALDQWRDDGLAEFPYDLVLFTYRHHGKHFVPPAVLRELAEARASLSTRELPETEFRRLSCFLSIALDKWDDNHTYHTYLGLDLLDLGSGADAATARRLRQRLVGLLLADVHDFEMGARDGAHDWLPQRRPGADLFGKRMTLLGAALTATAGDLPGSSGDIDGAVRELRAAAPADLRRDLALSLQPVFVIHDEYMFIRVLQAFEVTFAAMIAEMRDAIATIGDGDAESAAAHIRACAETFSGARRLFSLLATMEPESFQIFRAYTVGASAIQSTRYKTFEASCARPPDERFASPAFEAVPGVRDRIKEDWRDLTTVIAESTARGALSEDGLADVKTAARELEDVHQRWKQTHWKMACRMIGEERGTGYTVGVPYLKEAIDNRLFGELLRTSDG